MKNVVIKDRLLCDLELLLCGAFNPLKGFLKEKDYLSVCKDMRLSSGEVWPIPIVYPIKQEEHKEYEKLEYVTLVDSTNLPLAKFYIEDIYKPNLLEECRDVLGSDDSNHPYYNEIMKNKDGYYVGGRLEKINLPFHFDFKDIRRTPEEVRQLIKDQNIDIVVGFQTRNPMHKCHFELVKYAMNEVKLINKKVGCLIHPVVGITQTCDIDYHSRVRCYKKIIPHFENNSAILSLLPLSMRMAGPREALLHALIRKNYGCTHFIVGRDHAGPSYKKQNGEKFYGDYDSHLLLNNLADEIGIKVVMSKMIMYVVDEQKYMSEDQINPNHQTCHISGTEQRRLLKEGKDIPEWFSFPEVVAELKQVYKPNYKKGFCIYLVGLSGSGKSVLSSKLNDVLSGLESTRKITLLDGDVIRQNLSSGLGFSKKDRSTNVRRIGYVASEVVKHGGICICSNIAPYDEDRLFNRKLISEYGGYFEVVVDTPLDICEERDCKGLYKLAREGKIKEFTGISDPFENSSHSDLTLLNNQPSDINKNINLIIEKLRKHFYLK